jgi:hypothetical protein
MPFVAIKMGCRQGARRGENLFEPAPDKFVINAGWPFSFVIRT